MRNKLTDELAVCGLNAVLATAEYNSNCINRLFLREDRLKFFTGLCRELAERKRPYKICADEELERICKSTHHQGIVAMIIAPALEPLSRDDLDEWSGKSQTGLVLHAVKNDHNIGAIIRSAAFFDAAWIVVTGENEDFALSTSIYRIAEGGMEHVTVRTVQNAPAFLKEASKKIITIGTDIRARQRLRDMPLIIQTKTEALLKKKLTYSGSRPGIAVVLGNEETGLPPDVKEACSCLMRVPGTGLMESLNVSQAASLFLNELYNL